jgi:hypothetical protein
VTRGLWLLFLVGWWPGVIFGRLSQEMDLGWWDTGFLFLVGILTVWLAYRYRDLAEQASR